MSVTHDEDKHSFSMMTPGGIAVLQYRRVGSDAVDFYSTFVPPAARGGGFAAKLTAAALQWAEDQNLQVQASCSYVERYMERKQR